MLDFDFNLAIPQCFLLCLKMHISHPFIVLQYHFGLSHNEEVYFLCDSMSQRKQTEKVN